MKQASWEDSCSLKTEIIRVLFHFIYGKGVVYQKLIIFLNGMLTRFIRATVSCWFNDYNNTSENHNTTIMANIVIANFVYDMNHFLPHTYVKINYQTGKGGGGGDEQVMTLDAEVRHTEYSIRMHRLWCIMHSSLWCIMHSSLRCITHSSLWCMELDCKIYITAIK